MSSASAGFPSLAAPVSSDPSVNSGPCICDHCVTDEYLVPETFIPAILPGQSGALGWDTSYWCSNCGTYFGHLTDKLPSQWR